MTTKDMLARVVLGAAIATTSMVGCAGSPTAGVDEAAFDDYEAGEDGKADAQANVPLRNRATWKRRLDACKATFDGKYEPGLGNEGAVLSEYTACLAAANDRTIARIGRNIAENRPSDEPTTWGDIYATFEGYREASNDYCDRVSGLAVEDYIEGGDAGIHAYMQSLFCSLDTELDLTSRIANTIAWADVTDGASEFSTEDYAPGGISAFQRTANTPSCFAAFGQEAETALSTVEMVDAQYNLTACIANAFERAATAEYTGSFGDAFGPAARADYVSKLVSSFERVVDTGGSTCGLVARASLDGGGTIASIYGASCTTSVASKLAVWLDDSSPLEPPVGSAN